MRIQRSFSINKMCEDLARRISTRIEAQPVSVSTQKSRLEPLNHEVERYAHRKLKVVNFDNLKIIASFKIDATKIVTKLNENLIKRTLIRPALEEERAKIILFSI